MWCYPALLSLVNTETEISFLLKLMIDVHIFQTSPATGNEAKSHICTMDPSRGRLLGYLALLGTRKVVVKAKLISRPMGAWTGFESSQRSQSHTALMFEVPKQ